MTDDQQRAKELLAESYERHGELWHGMNLRHESRAAPYAAEISAITAALRAAPEWQPIETAPKDDTPVDLWRPVCGGERLANMRRIELSPGNVFYTAIESGYTCVRDATHWMPLPSPPLAARPQGVKGE